MLAEMGEAPALAVRAVWGGALAALVAAVALEEAQRTDKSRERRILSVHGSPIKGSTVGICDRYDN